MNQDRITDGQAQVRMPQWRMLVHRAHLAVDCGGFGKAMEFVNGVAELATKAKHHPDIDVRFSTVHLALSSHDVGGMSERDVELGEQIVELARSRGHAFDYSQMSSSVISIDTRDPDAIRPFWQAVYGYEAASDDFLVDPQAIGPSIWFQETDDPGSGTTGRNRIHIDVYVPHDEVEERLAAAEAVGARLVTAEFAPSWWVLADPDGNEACLCTWQSPPNS